MIAACMVTLGVPTSANAVQAGSISGTIVDPVGASVSGAVALYRGGEEVARATSRADGTYTFEAVEPGRYQVEASAATFDPVLSTPVFVGDSGDVVVNLTVPVGALRQEVTVTASASALPVAQVAVPVTVISSELLDRLGKPDVLETLRTVPGLSVVQTGARGGTASVFTRGGESDWNKVLIDGAPANDIGGSFSFDALSTAAVESVEVLRTANSVVYGSDAMSGVVAVETRRGRTRIPTVTYTVDGGNLGTSRNEVSVGGAVGRFDYFVDGFLYDTNNDVPNNEYRNESFASRIGFLLGSNTDISATLRRTETDFESPNAILHFGIPDDSNQDVRQTYVTARSVTAASPATITLQYTFSERDGRFVNPSPTGEPYDPFALGANYLGDQVTITGENGFSTTGRAILDFGGSYPSVSNSNSKRYVFSGSADVDVTDRFAVSFGGRIEDEEGMSSFSAVESRRNHGYFVEGRGNMGQRLFIMAGLGIEDHAVFGQEVVPRFSAAFYARQPSTSAALGETKLMFTIGEGIKAPNVFEAQSSIFNLLQGFPELISQYGLRPIDPERTRTIDAGIEQRFWNGQVRAGISYFDNRNEDLIEFVSSNILPQLGVPEDVADASGFGAYVNAASFDSRGVELSGEVVIGTGLRVSGFYTFLDAEVTESFASSALGPAFNPAFPDIQIGQYSPLVGGRPFRRPTHSGGITASYSRGGGIVSVTAAFVGKQDDSTFLSDQDFGSTMLLPNRDLSGNYQKVDVSGSYDIHPRVRWYGTVENLFDQEFLSAMGFPGLPIAVRSGVKFILGGDGI
jgi:iron complex outermembrane receptor protein/vitamin B12 transporter